MNWQQWNLSLFTAPRGVPLAINTGGYIFRGTIYGNAREADTPEHIRENFYIRGPYGQTYRWDQISTWSWSATEPESEMLMVKPHGIFMAHWWNEVGHLLRIIRDFDVKLFVEIGILDGGLSSLILSEVEYSTDMHYLGIDQVAEHYLDQRVKAQCDSIPGGRAQWWSRDAWDQQTIAMVLHCIQTRIHDDQRVMIYCDGGDKPKEASLYWPLLSSGDLLGVHDYSDDPNAVGPEVFPNDVAQILAEGKRRGQEELKDTRILLVEKP